MFKSTDGGMSWAAFNDGLADTNVYALAIDASGGQINAATVSGVFSYSLRTPPSPVQTATGFYYPIGTTITGDQNWNACGVEYFSNTRHVGADLFYDSAPHNNDNNIGKPVYAILKGTVVKKSGPSECSGWGIDNFALVIRHSSTTGDFLAVYGHMRTTLNLGDLVSAGDQIGTIAPYEEHQSYGRDTAKNCKFSGNIVTRKAHLHFGVFPGTDKFPSGGWGRVSDTKCMHPDSTNGFVNPLDWIVTRIPVN